MERLDPTQPLEPRMLDCLLMKVEYKLFRKLVNGEEENPDFIRAAKVHAFDIVDTIVKVANMYRDRVEEGPGYQVNVGPQAIPTFQAIAPPQAIADPLSTIPLFSQDIKNLQLPFGHQFDMPTDLLPEVFRAIKHCLLDRAVPVSQFGTVFEPLIRKLSIVSSVNAHLFISGWHHFCSFHQDLLQEERVCEWGLEVTGELGVLFDLLAGINFLLHQAFTYEAYQFIGYWSGEADRLYHWTLTQYVEHLEKGGEMVGFDNFSVTNIPIRSEIISRYHIKEKVSTGDGA